MHLSMRNRDYIPDGAGGFLTAGDSERRLEEALYRLSARRGRFDAFPELGSRLYLLSRVRPSERKLMAVRYAQEALEPMKLHVLDADVAETDVGLRVAVYLEESEGALEVQSL